VPLLLAAETPYRIGPDWREHIKKCHSDELKKTCVFYLIPFEASEYKERSSHRIFPVDLLNPSRFGQAPA